MVFRRDEISNMWVPDIQHEAHDAPFHVRIDASFKQDTKGITNAGRWRLIASASARDWLREGIVGLPKIRLCSLVLRLVPTKGGSCRRQPAANEWPTEDSTGAGAYRSSVVLLV